MLDHVSRLLRFVGTFGFLGDCVKILYRYKWNYAKGFIKWNVAYRDYCFGLGFEIKHHSYVLLPFEATNVLNIFVLGSSHIIIKL